jgi:hypothetical protein
MASYPGHHSWAILPATQALLNKTKCTLEEAMRVYGGGTILICTRENNDGSMTPMYISSAGTMTYPVGSKHDAHHDQSFARYGRITVHACVEYSIVNDQVVTTVPSIGFGKGPLTLDSKAPLFCFK